MKLYYSPGACSLSPHIILHEAGIPHERVLVNLRTRQLEDGRDFCLINPLGYVPVLELDDGRRLVEGPAIDQYLADQVPDRQLVPANGTFERYQVQGWLNFIATELHKNFSPLFRPGTSEEAKATARSQLEGRFRFIEEQLARQDYLAGAFSIADIYLFVVCRWMDHVGLPLAAWPALQAHHQRLASRPAVQAALQAENLKQ